MKNVKKAQRNETIIKDIDSLTENVVDSVINDTSLIRLEDISYIRKRNVNTSNFLNEAKSTQRDESLKDTTANVNEDIFTHNEETTEYYDPSNYTEEPCVGDPEFCNMTREDYFEMLNDYIYPQPYEWVLIVTHAIVFVIGLIGNALVCVAVYRNHSMRTVTNYFIVNLAVADFMVILICLPPTVLWDVTETWFFGTAMCRIVLYFQLKSLQ
ncbi:unnamed protein product [Leptidea sinapis]|uniref:G-protein coupled receptors family 1 profile domain-containing protein n=1 Tax=Leptidea sinapis TaxID=189913 RepID=A0A5E4QRZ8_9NEOP|nr:unnamed protein product [Leptidea sinapis]